jgi:hypothetical protein
MLANFFRLCRYGELVPNYGMKSRGFFLVLVACILAGCHTDNYNWRTEILIVGYTGYDKVAQAVKKHVYAAPGARLDDFERAIKRMEHKTNEMMFDADFSPKADGVWRYNYEGKTTVYYGKFIKAQAPPPKNSPIFDVDEISDPVSLAAKLKASSDPVSADLFGRFSDEGRSMIAGYPQSGLDKEALQGVLARELNAIIGGPLIYEEHRFGGITLRSTETYGLKLHPRAEHDAALLRAGLNRLLLEDAYPQELAKVPPRVDWKHAYVAIKY